MFSYAAMKDLLAELDEQIAHTEALVQRAAYEAQAGMSEEDPQVLEQIAREADERKRQEIEQKRKDDDQKRRDGEQKLKKKLVDELWQLHRDGEAIRDAANTSATFYRQSDRPEAGKTERLIEKMEDTAQAAFAFRDRVMAALVSVSDETGKDGIRADLSASAIQALVQRYRAEKAALKHDLMMEAELQKGDTSLGGAAAYTLTATGVATLAAANGAASELPIVGEMYERFVGSKVKAGLKREATGALDAEMASDAVERGDVIGKVAATIPQAVNPTHAAVVIDKVGHAFVESATGEDVATRKELSGAEIAVNAVDALAAGLGSLSKLAGAPKILVEAASGTDKAKKIFDVADNTTAAVAGRRLSKPEEELTGTERAFAGLTALGEVAEAAASSTKVGKAAAKAGTKSKAQKAVEAGKKTLKHVETADNVAAAATGYSALKEKEVETADRIKAAGGAMTTGIKDVKAVTDELARDVGDAIRDVDLSR